MKPYYVIRINAPAEREQYLMHNRREFPYVYDEEQAKSEGVSCNSSVFGVATPEHAELLLGWLTTRYPDNSYMIVKSIKAGYRDPGPLKFGVFTEEGFMPE